MAITAFTREVPESLARCELVHLRREPIDVARARHQHARYAEALQELGCTVRRLPAAHDLPDSVFVEDTVVVLPELAILTRPGAASRRPEVDAVAHALGALLPTRRMEEPATLDGGDVLLVGRRIYVGRSGRTSAEGIDALRRFAGPHGYEVIAVALSGCLHLKTAVTQVAEGLLLTNGAWVDADAFGGVGRLEVDPSEPFAANALALPGGIVYPAAFPRTRARLEARGLHVLPVDVSELAKAEGGVTCGSILVPQAAPAGGGAVTG